MVMKVKILIGRILVVNKKQKTPENTGVFFIVKIFYLILVIK